MSRGGTTAQEGAGPAHRGFTGVVPAAGASRRMGRAKALLDYDGATFLERVVTALSGGGCTGVVVVVGPDSEPIRAAAEATGADVLMNPDPGDGPITSMRLAIRALDPDSTGIAWLPLDFPLVKPEHVRRLIAEAESTGAPVTLPVFGAKRGHPAIFRSALFPELTDEALEGGARTVVHRHLGEARLVPFDEAAVVTDVDTPDAYAALPAP